MISNAIDKLIRRSSLGVLVSHLRERNPASYAFLRDSYQKLFALKSKHGLARYQVRSINTFLSVAPVNKERPFLEIGSDLEVKTIQELHELGFQTLVGINPAFDDIEITKRNAELPEGCSLQKGDIRNFPAADASFGSIFSISVFEHLLDFEQCIQEMYRLLEPQGYLYAEFGPIWSSSLGHHVYANVNGKSARHWDPNLNPVKNHSHMLLNKDEMRSQLLADGVDVALSDEIVTWIYDSPYINRLFFEDYLNILEASDFDIVHMEFDKEYIAPELQSQLEEKYPGYKTFNVRNIECALCKQ